MASLDMSLDDMIKKKGGGGGGGGGRGGRGGKKRGAGGDQASAGAAAEKKPERRSGLSAATKSALGAVGKDKAAKSKGPLGTLGAAFKGLGLPVRTFGVKPVDTPASETKNTPAKERAPRKNKPVAKPPAEATSAKAPKGTEDKLGMSLDDMIKFEVPRKKGKKQEKGKADGAAAAPAEGGGARPRGGRRRRGMMKLHREAPAPRAKAQGKAKARSGARGRGGPEWGKGGGKQWVDDGWAGGGGMRSWAGGRGKRSQVEDYDDWGPAPPAKRARAASGADFGWGGGRGEGRGYEDRWGPSEHGWGGGGRAGRGMDGPGWSRDWDDRDRAPVRERERERPRVPRAPDDWQPAKAARDPDPPPRAQREAGRRPGAFTTIRVSNVPRGLDHRDIKDAFEDSGRVLMCEVERGVAFVTFDSPVDAKKAVQTFDRGELNGQTIYVTPEP